MSKSLTDLKIAVQMVQSPTTLILEASQLYHHFSTRGTLSIRSDPQPLQLLHIRCTTSPGTRAKPVVPWLCVIN